VAGDYTCAIKLIEASKTARRYSERNPNATAGCSATSRRRGGKPVV